MVLEALINPVSAEKRPAQMIFLGILYASVALWLSIWIFYEHASLVMVFLTVLASVPIVYNTIKLEERKDERMEDEVLLLEEHWKALEVFLFLFIGYSISYAVWYVVLPYLTPLINGFIHIPSGAAVNLFKTQTNTILNINSNVIGMAAQLGRFETIMLNNIKVLVFCLLFSVVYGLGAIFILAWNASVIGAAIGMYITDGVSKLTGTGVQKAVGYVQIYTIGFLKYSIHGIPEILAYFVAGLAGGIISIAVIKQNIGTKQFEHILWDASDLIILSVVILVIAAVLEVWVTPLVF